MFGQNVEPSITVGDGENFQLLQSTVSSTQLENFWAFFPVLTNWHLDTRKCRNTGNEANSHARKGRSQAKEYWLDVHEHAYFSLAREELG